MSLGVRTNWLLALVTITSLSCRNSPPPVAVERVAILPFENLTGDAALDWIGSSVQGAVVNQLVPVANLASLAVPAVRDAYLSRPTRLVTGYVERAPAGLRLRAVIEDPAARKVVSEFVVARKLEAFPEAVDALSRLISPQARPALTRSWPAFAALGRAQRSGTAEERRALLEQAIAADANYAPAYLALAELNLATNNADGAKAALSRLESRKPAPFESAQAKAALAAIEGNVAARVQALAEMAQASPANAALQFQAGSALVTAKRFAEGARAFSRGLVADPDNGDMWNSLGYARAYARDLPGAKEALARYARIAPGPNNIDSLAEVHYHAGQFAEAKRLFLENLQKNDQSFGDVSLIKAAYTAFRMEGAPAGDPLFARYLKRLRDRKEDLRSRGLEFDWLYATGRRADAIAQTRSLAASGERPAQAIAHTHLCGYLLADGQRAPALEAAKAALAITPNNLAAVLCFFAAQPSAPDTEWIARAGKLFADPRAAAVRKQALAYALFFDRHYAAAEVLLRDLYLQAPAENEGELRVMLAAALLEQNKSDEARQLMSFWPLPPSSDGLFQAWVFARTGELMAKLKPPAA